MDTSSRPTIADPCIGTGFTLNEDNLFTNYGIGTFDECCGESKTVDVDTSHDFEAILTTNINKILNNNPVTETGCTFTNDWILTTFLSGTSFDVNNFLTTTGTTTAPTEAQYMNALFDLSGTTTLTGATFSYNSSTSIVTISIENNCSTINDGDISKSAQTTNVLYLKVELCVSTGYNCTDETVSGLTAFRISTLSDDACNPTAALPLGELNYHNGASALPTVGDNIYEDANGITPAEFISGAERFMGGDWTLPTSWIRTNANGLMLSITCVERTCLVSTGQGIAPNEQQIGLYNDMFWIDGVTQARNTNITYELFDVVYTSGVGSGLFVTISSGKFTTAIQLSEKIPIVSTSVLVSPNGGYNTRATKNPYDYDAYVSGASLTSSDVSWKVRMTVTYIEGECILGSNIQTITYGTTR